MKYYLTLLILLFILLYLILWYNKTNKKCLTNLPNFDGQLEPTYGFPYMPIPPQPYPKKPKTKYIETDPGFLNYTTYTKNDFPILCFYNRQSNIKSNLSNEYSVIVAAIKDINEKTKFKFFKMTQPTHILPKIDKREILFINDATYKHDCLREFDGPDNILAHAQMPPNKKICIDCSEKWTEDDLRNTLIHELGHTLGLGHNRSRKAIMFDFFVPELQGLQPRDIKNLQKLYPFIPK